ncbi:MAG: DUF421 domain-containing protein [Ruminococcaceae bacterium]|nr:DUF421 domain-containing protein [Oscillospiraceae bacterium]
MLTTIIRVVILYLFVSASIRIMGKRNIGELQPTELVITLLLSEFASIPIEDNSVPLINSLIPVMILISLEIINSVISMKSTKFRSISDGNALLIIKDGKLDQKQLKKLRFTVDDVLSALRQKDVFDINEVAYAIIETNGTLSVLLKPQFQNATKQDVKVKTKNDGYTCPVIIDGVVLKKNLDVLEINKEDIERILEKKKVHKKQIFLMNIDKNKNAEIILKE